MVPDISGARRQTYDWLKSQGLQATRVRPGSKGWYEPEGAPAAGHAGYTVPPLSDWGSRDGIGALLGAKFGGLIDGDHDCRAARELAPRFFPAAVVFGRKSTPRSHMLWRVSGSEPFPTLAFKLPGKMQHGELKNMLFELRGDVAENGIHTVLPGSIHKDSGEAVLFDGEPAALEVVDRAALLAAAYEFGITLTIIEGGLYPEGARHDICSAISGMLMRCGWTETRVMRIMSAVTDYLGADKIHLKQIPQTFEKAKNPKSRLRGKPALVKLLGATESIKACVDLIQEYTREGKAKAPGAAGGRGVNINNAETVALALEKIGVELFYDEWTRRALACIEGEEPVVLNKGVRLDIWGKLEDDAGLCFNRQYLDDRITVIARKNRQHAFLDAVRATPWDGVKRLETLFIDYLGARDTPLVRAAAVASLVGAARKVLKPGTRTRIFPVFEGPQGIGKSEFVKILALKPEWYTEDLDLLAANRDIIEQSRGKIFADQGELSRIKGKDYERIKDAITRTADCASLKYDPEAETYPRTFSLFGSHNPTGGPILIDPSGNTRFIPIPVQGYSYEGQLPDSPNRFRRDELERDKWQIWAEILTLEASGTPHDLPGHVYQQLKEESEERAAESPWEDIVAASIERHVEEQLAEAAKKGKPAPARIMVASSVVLGNWLSIPIERQSPAAGAKLAEIMFRLGHEKCRLPGKRNRKGARGYAIYTGEDLEGVEASREAAEREKELTRLRRQKSKLTAEAVESAVGSPERAALTAKAAHCTREIERLEALCAAGSAVVTEMPPGAPEI